MAGEKGAAAAAGGEGKGAGEGEEGMSVADLERRILEADADDLLTDDEGDEGDAGDGGAEAEAARESEREAMSKGWTPKDKFKGDPSKWVDAKTFIERGKRFNQNLQNENAALKKQLAEFKGTADAFRKFHKDSMEQRDAALVKARADLKKALRIADREENDDLVEEIEGRLALIDDERAKVKKDIEEVQKPAAETAPAAVEGQPLDPILEEWINSDNQWFRTNQRMMASAIVIGQELKKEHGDTLVGRAFLDRVREEMESEFPEKFKPKETPPARRSVVDTGSRNARSTGSEKTIRDLPPEDRKLCAQFVAEGWVKEKDFIKSYFERNPS